MLRSPPEVKDVMFHVKEIKEMFKSDLTLFDGAGITSMEVVFLK